MIFRKWLLDTFPKQSFAFVLDVAGGSGLVGVPLCIAGHRTTIIDPRIDDEMLQKNAIVKNLAYHIQQKNTKTYLALKSALAGSRFVNAETGEIDQLPMPEKLRELFRSDDAADSDLMKTAKSRCSLVIGLHPDQATEPIVDFALKNRRPFAVVPCCVFPRENPHRRLQASGKKVQSYEDFVAYLLEKDPVGIRAMTLDFDGRNTVLYHLGGDN